MLIESEYGNYNSPITRILKSQLQTTITSIYCM